MDDERERQEEEEKEATAAQKSSILTFTSAELFLLFAFSFHLLTASSSTPPPLSFLPLCSPFTSPVSSSWFHPYFLSSPPLTGFASSSTKLFLSSVSPPPHLFHVFLVFLLSSHSNSSSLLLSSPIFSLPFLLPAPPETFLFPSLSYTSV